jgi:hypothetical protein
MLQCDKRKKRLLACPQLCTTMYINQKLTRFYLLALLLQFVARTGKCMCNVNVASMYHLYMLYLALLIDL